MASLGDVVRFLDGELRTPDVPDYDGALNGLQLANAGQVTRVAAAVDYSSRTVGGAHEQGADLLIVHHGMFWGGAQRLVGGAFDRLRTAISGNLAVYSSHLPLDLHPTLGNNALLASALDLKPDRPFGRYKDIHVGVSGTADLATRALVERLRAVSARYATTLVTTPFADSRRTRRWAIITGSGASSGSLAEAQAAGVDTLVVGEGPHHTAVEAIDSGMCIAYAGHYATETFGVRALAATVAERFGLPWVFVDSPTGL